MKKTKLDKPLLIVMLVLMLFGLIMVLSASSMASYMRYHKNIYDYFIKQGIFMLGGYFQEKREVKVTLRRMAIASFVALFSRSAKCLTISRRV